MDYKDSLNEEMSGFKAHSELLKHQQRIAAENLVEKNALEAEVQRKEVQRQILENATRKKQLEEQEKLEKENSAKKEYAAKKHLQAEIEVQNALEKLASANRLEQSLCAQDTQLAVQRNKMESKVVQKAPEKSVASAATTKRKSLGSLQNLGKIPRLTPDESM